MYAEYIIQNASLDEAQSDNKIAGRNIYNLRYTALSNSMKLWAMPRGATQDGWVMVETSEKMLSTREGNGKPLQYSCLENPMKRQKDRTLKDELLRFIGAQYATGDQWRNNFRKNEEMESKNNT